MKTPVICIANYGSGEVISQKELAQLSDSMADADEAEPLMNGLFHRFESGAMVENGELRMAFEREPKNAGFRMTIRKRIKAGLAVARREAS